jgi:SNF2 family DNA or RNA helicase
LLKWAEDKNGDGGIRAPKLRKVIELITKKIPPNEKYLIFSNYKTALDLTQCAIEAFTTDSVLMINGDVVGQERNAAITEFKNNSDIRGMLLTYGVGSEGINFTCANHVIFLEPWWSHAVHHQAYSRAHRIGQTRHVHTYYIIVKDSIEEVIQEVCNKKIKEIKDFFGDENDISSSKGISVEAIKTIAGVRRA